MTSLEFAPGGPSGEHPVDANVILGRLGKVPLIGRGGPAQLLSRSIANLHAGDGSVFLLFGEAGIGKTRLIREVLRTARESEFRALHAECLAEPGAPPYDVWIRALRSLPDDRPASMLEGLERSRKDAQTGAGARQESVARNRYRLFTEFFAALASLAYTRPVVICLDDMQWAEASSLQLFQFVAMNAQAAPIVLIGAARSEEASAGSPLAEAIGFLQRNHRGTRIDLNPLTSEETTEFVERLLGGTTASLASKLYAHSDGNPFVLEETVRLLAATGKLDEGEIASPQTALPVPPGVSASIRSRIDALEGPERDVLDAGAIAGKRFEGTLVAIALGLEQLTCEQSLEVLCQASLLKRELAPRGASVTTYGFLHDRIRDVVLEAMAPATTARLHLRIAEALKQDGAASSDPDRIGALAHHYQMAGKLDAAAEFFVHLGDLSMDRNAPENAVSAYSNAIDLYKHTSSGPPEGMPVEFALGKALLAMGKRAAVDAFKHASNHFLAAGRHRRAAEATEYAALALSANEDHQRALASYQLALDLLAQESDASIQRASILVHMSETLGMGLGRFHEAMRAQRKALEILTSEKGGTALRCQASLALARTMMRINRLPEAASVIEEALPTAVLAGELLIAAELEGALANVRYWQGIIGASKLCTLRRQHHNESAGDPFSRRHIDAWKALLEVAAGNWKEAGRLLDEAEEQSALLDSPEPLAFTRQIRGHLAFSMGDYDPAWEHFDAALESFRLMGAATSLWYFGYAARAAYLAGRHDQSEALRADTQALLEDLPAGALPSGASLTELALLAVDAGAVERMPALYDALSPYAGQFHWHLIDRARGLLAMRMDRTDLAARHFDAAIAQARAYGLRPELELINEHRARFGIPQETPAAAAYVASPWPGPPFPQHNPAGLTDREVEILRLVASGLTNKEIADTLSISDKTVTNHITHIFDKADLANRAAAAAFAVRHRLI